MLASVIEAEARNEYGGVHLNAIEFRIYPVRPDGPFAWSASAKCSNESRTGYGGADSLTLRSRGGFSTVEGALGSMSEVAAIISIVYPQIVLIFFTSQWTLKRFEVHTRSWIELPSRRWKCRTCDSELSLPPLLWFRSGLPLCQSCEKLMREVDRPAVVDGVPGP